MKTTAVFRWKGHLPDDEEVGADPSTRYSNDFGEQWAYQACRPVAVSLFEAICKRGLITGTNVPHFDEHAWYFSVQLEPQDYEIAVMWVPRGGGDDAFAVQPSLRRGCLASLFLSRPDDSALRQICALLRDLLETHPQIADLDWVDDVEDLWN